MTRAKKAKEIKRPYLVKYYDSYYGSKPVAHGATKTDFNAKKAVVHVYLEKHVQATIIDRHTGEIVLSMKRMPHTGSIITKRGREV